MIGINWSRLFHLVAVWHLWDTVWHGLMDRGGGGAFWWTCDAILDTDTLKYDDTLTIPSYFLIFPALLGAVLSLALIAVAFVALPIIYRYTFVFSIIHKSSILHRSGVRPNLADHIYCPICRKSCTSKFMGTICCQAPRSSLDNVSKTPPPPNVSDSYFGKGSDTEMRLNNSEPIKWRRSHLQNPIKLHFVHQKG